MTLLQWLEDYTILHELLVLLLVLWPPLAVFWVLRKRQFRRQDADRPE
jgi:hypothetical protein